MKKEGFDFFQNRACEYFPCHKGVADEDFNCLFCYCPLYLLWPLHLHFPIFQLDV